MPLPKLPSRMGDRVNARNTREADAEALSPETAHAETEVPARGAAKKAAKKSSAPAAVKTAARTATKTAAKTAVESAAKTAAKTARKTGQKDVASAQEPPEPLPAVPETASVATP